MNDPVAPSLDPPTPEPDPPGPEHPPHDDPAPDEMALEDSRLSRALRGAVEWMLVVVGALVIALLLKAYVFQVFHIPSSSMEPTLADGHRIVVNKIDDEPERSDVVVFTRPAGFPAASGDAEHLVKRVIGLPGDEVRIDDGRVFVNERAIEEPYLAVGTRTALSAWSPGCANDQPLDGTCVVPDDTYYVLGDNRSNSQDGRIFGPIPSDLIVGTAALRVYPLNRIGGI
ncbi:MAG: signal peptidase I [Acidimicrobiales bacterium]|nr:signal peptidase I [Acidimicrobiales bacterium]